jgi:O-acetylserine/cysteine efflux transporter
MPPRHAFAAALVMTIWGVNFVVIDKGLAGVPPLLFVAIRFSVVLLALPFVPRPDVPWRHLALVGGFMSVGQFGFLYSGLAAGMPPGLASLVLQAQAVVTVVLAVVILGERPAAIQVAGIGLGVIGLLVVAAGRGGHVPSVGVVLTVLGAVSWACGNIAVRRLGLRGGLGVTVWSAAVVPLPMLALSLVVDGPAVVGHALTHLSMANVLSTLYTAGLASIVGYAVWNTLLARHTAASVAPWSLLVPPIGILTAYVVDHEVPTGLAVAGGVVLVAGVALTTLGPRLVAGRRTVEPLPAVPTRT